MYAFLSVVAGILSATHKIGRHVVTVTRVNEMAHAELITDKVPNGKFLENVNAPLHSGCL